jgi:hypothetical protein
LEKEIQKGLDAFQDRERQIDKDMGLSGEIRKRRRRKRR